MFKKRYFVCLLAFMYIIKAQSTPIQKSTSTYTMATLESVLLQQEKILDNHYMLQDILKPLEHTKAYAIVQEALLANLYSQRYDAITTNGTALYKGAITKAQSIKNEPLIIWAQLNYVSHLYKYRDFEAMMPLVLDVIEKLKVIPADELLLPEESYVKLGWIMETLGDYPASLMYLNLARKELVKSDPKYALIIDNIGLNYFKLGKYNEAEACFYESLRLAKRSNDKLRYAKSQGNLALIHEQRKEYDSAITLLKEDLILSVQVANDQNTMYASILLAKIYIKAKQFSKATLLLDRAQLIAQGKPYFNKSEVEIIKLRLTLLTQEYDPEYELELRRKLLALQEAIKDKDGDIAIHEANWLIQKAKYQNNIDQATKESERHSLFKKIFGLIIVLLIFAAIIYYFKLKRQAKARRLKYKNVYSQLAREKKSTKLIPAAYLQTDDLGSTPQKLFKKQIVQFDFISRSNAVISTGKKETTPFQNRNGSHLMTEDNWNTFKKDFQKHNPEFLIFLKEQYPELTDSNKRILLLQKLDYSNREIAELLGITLDAVKKSKQRLKKKLGLKYDALFSNLKDTSL